MVFSIHNEYLTVSADEFGAQLSSIRDDEDTEYLWQGDPSYWNDRALNLFPFVAQLYNGTYCLDEKQYSMDIHGFAPYMTFKGCIVSSSCMEMLLTANEETLKHYPRQFTFVVRYTLINTTLAVDFEVHNMDELPMYFGLGGHPGFNVPLIHGKSFSDYQLRFEDACFPFRLGFTNNSLLDGTEEPFALDKNTILPLKHSMFDHDAIVLRNTSKAITLECPDDHHRVTVRFPQMDYLGIWHWPRTDAPYICIEPWCSLPATKDKLTIFEQKPDLIKLDPDEKYTNRWTITIQK